MKAAQIGKRLSAIWFDEDGVTAIEYALLAALIFGAIVISVALLGDSVKTLYDDIARTVTDAIL
ncbi:pilus assembly protein Flp/PilA [Aromatoleum tolulyticum]|uniref:Pilus assembly protein Flp/PilA n=1 Tax=Aromatoleum tolulyticum TaxID=34027 RepID=A0A1N7B1A0_9RHOO|nr:Flp family type IVb pilin [Aromatoleum tolulyticum]SIR45115.1 pilus assembly protein Flp/PilA [Aromatoleum tolulyticum]